MCSDEKRDRILDYAEKHSMAAASRKYGVNRMTVANWRQRRPKRTTVTVQPKPETVGLETENARLKKYIFEKMFLPALLRSVE